MKKTYKILLIAAAVVAVLVVAIALATAPVAKNYIEKHDRELLGRSIRMDRLRVNIFTGRLRVEGLRIGAIDDSTTFFRLDSFDMRLRLWPLLTHRIEIPHLHVTSPDLKIYQQGRVFNFDDLTARFLSDTTAIEEPGEPWAIGIYDIVLRDGHLFYKDLELDATWGFNDLNLNIPGVYFAGEKTDVGVVLNFAEGGSLSTQVAYDIENEVFDIGLHLRDLTLAGTLPYFQQSLDVERVAGLLSADIRLQGDVEHLLSLRTDGEASLAGFALYDRRQRPVLGIDTLRMKLAEADMGKMHFRIDKLYAGGISALFEMTADGGNNFETLTKPFFDAPAEIEESPAPDPTLHITDLEIARGRIDLRDATLERPFEYTVSDIRMRSRDFDPSTRNRLIIDARMQKTGSAKLRWEGTMDDLNNQNITLWLTNLDLRDFSPYCEHFTAYPVTHGNLTFRSQNVIRNRNLDGTNHLDAFEPKVDKKRKDIKPEMNIPLKLGLYVLKDKKGHVEMDLPVSGSLDSPEFSYRKIVMKAIGNVLLKVVTAPFSFLSGHKNNLEYIAVGAQQYAFSSEQYASFDQIAQMLQDKPEMHIALTQRIDLQRALPLQAAADLRMAYAEHLRADSTVVGEPAASRPDSLAPTRRPPLTMLEYEKIQQTDIRTPEVMTFADSLLTLQGRPSQGLSAEAKALALYSDKAAGELRRMMAARDRTLTEYMRSTHNLSAPLFRLQPMDSVALDSYTGHDRYTISLEVDGESVEIAPDADNTPASETVVSDITAPETVTAGMTTPETTAAAKTTAAPETVTAGTTAPETAAAGH